MPTNEQLRNAIRKAQPMTRMATYNASAIGKKSVAYEGRARMIGPFKRPNPKTGQGESRMVTRPFSERFTNKGEMVPGKPPIKK